jgi:hypothetical protein
VIVVANGAQKSGSTWLFHIAREMTGYGPPPAQYAARNWTSRPVYGVHPPLLAAFLEDAGSGPAKFLIKNHFGGRADRELLLRHPQVRVLNIQRDIRDVIVSAFYHRHGVEGVRDSERYADFKSYYWQAGRNGALRVLDYQIVWEVRSSRYLRVAYDDLQADVGAEVRRIGDFLGMSLASEDIRRIQLATTPEAVMERYGAANFDLNRFRKGVSGDWKNHFDAPMAADISRIVRLTQRPLHRLALRGPRALYRLYRRWRFAL